MRPKAGTLRWSSFFLYILFQFKEYHEWLTTCHECASTLPVIVLLHFPIFHQDVQTMQTVLSRVIVLQTWLWYLRVILEEASLL